MRGTASALELSWSAVAVVGLFFTAWMIVDAYLDYRAVGAAITGGYAKARGARFWIAIGALVGNGLTAFVWAGFLLVGLIAMQYPPPPPSQDQTVSNMWAGWVLIGMEALLASIQVWSRIVRLKVVGLPHTPQTGSRP